jgi:hypothetical protein
LFGLSGRISKNERGATRAFRLTAFAPTPPRRQRMPAVGHWWSSRKIPYAVSPKKREVKTVYNFVATFIGVLKDREIVARERLLKAEGLAAIGKSIAAVAYDMKTSLVVIGGFTRQLHLTLNV